MIDIEKAKKDTIARLETLERVALDVKSLRERLADLDVNGLIEAHVHNELEKIRKYALKRGMDDLELSENDFAVLVKVPNSSLPEGHTILPFTPANHRQQLQSVDWPYHTYYYSNGAWSTEEWDSSWDSSSANC